MKPSTSAILVPANDSAAWLALVEEAFAAHGFERSDAPLPTGYRPRRDERLELGLGWGQWEGSGLLIPSDVDAVFRIALWLSESAGSTPLVALRRYMGLPPVIKLYIDGKPRWKDGVDDDLEVSFPVVTHRPLDLQGPEESGLPASAVAMERALSSLLDDKQARRSPRSRLEWRAYLSRKSRLAQG